MHNAPALPFSADDGGGSTRVVGIRMLAAIIGASLLGSYLLIPDQSQLVERLMRDQQYERIQEMLRSTLGTTGGIDPAEFQKLGGGQLAALSHLLRLTPREQLQTIFSTERPLDYDRFIHAVTLSAVRYVDVISPEQAWRMIAPFSQKMPASYFAELATILSRNALATSRPDLSATILSQACGMEGSPVVTAHDMVQSYRSAGKPQMGADQLLKWFRKHEGKSFEANPAELSALRALGSTVALEGGDPSTALDFHLMNLKALPADAPLETGQIETALSLAGQCSRTADAVPWLARYVNSMPESKVDWKKLPELQAKNPERAAEYIRWTRLQAQYADWSSQFDPAFDAHFRLAALGEMASLDRCIALCDFLGRGEEMADLLQYSDIALSRPALQAKLAALLAGLGRDTEALPLYQRWIAANPDDVEAAHDLGCLLQDMGREDDALEAFEAVVKLHPKHVPTVKKLAESCIRAGRHERALELYKNLSDEDHDHYTLENYALLAESLDRHEELFRAQVLHTRQETLTTVEPYLEIAETAGYIPSAQPAIDILNEGLNKFPDSPSIRVALATVWMRDLNNVDQCYATLKHDSIRKSFEGVTMLLEIASSIPDQRDLLAFLGPNIENQFELSARSRLDLAVLCHFCGDSTRCERLFAQVPETPRNLSLIAEARFQMNSVDESIRLMTQFLTGNIRATSEEWIFLGELYEITGQTEAAERAYQQSLSLLTSDLPDQSSVNEIKTSDSTASPSRSVITPQNTTLTAP